MQCKPLIPQHVCLLLLCNQLLFLYYCSFRIKPAVWPNLPDHKKTLEQLCKKPKNVCTSTITFTWLLGTKLTLTTDSKCCMNWDIFQKLLVHFTEDSPHLHRQMLVKGVEITNNSASAWAFNYTKSLQSLRNYIWRKAEGTEFVYRKEEAWGGEYKSQPSNT